MSTRTGISVNQEVLDAYTHLKSRKQGFIILKVSDDDKHIEVADKSDEEDYDIFRTKLIESKTKNSSGDMVASARYGVYYLVYKTGEGGRREKLVLISWIPDNAPMRQKMLYSTSSGAVTEALDGFQKYIEAHDIGEIEHDEILSNFKDHA